MDFIIFPFAVWSRCSWTNIGHSLDARKSQVCPQNVQVPQLSRNACISWYPQLGQFLDKYWIQKSSYVMLRLRTSEDRTTAYKSYPGALYSTCYMEIFTHTVPIITSFTWLQPGCKVSPLVRSTFFGQNGRPSKRATL